MARRGIPKRQIARQLEARQQLASATATGRIIHELPLSQIEPDPEQPRRHIDKDELTGLAATIKQHGLRQPIEVERIAPDRYRLIHGERRWRAARLARLKRIQAVVRVNAEATPAQRQVVQLVENVQRADLTAGELARAVQQLVGQGLPQTQISEQLGKSKSTISKLAASGRLLAELPEALQEQVSCAKLGQEALYKVTLLRDPAERLSALEALLVDAEDPEPTAPVERSARAPGIPHDAWQPVVAQLDRRLRKTDLWDWMQRNLSQRQFKALVREFEADGER